MDKLLPLKLPPGMRNTGTVYQSKDRWYSGNLVRFFNDTIQPIGGWTKRTLTGSAATVNSGAVTTGKTYIITVVGTSNWTAIGASSNAIGVIFTATGSTAGTGTCVIAIGGSISACHSWADSTGETWIAVGTTNGLYVVKTSTNAVYDVTPAPVATVIPESNLVWSLDNFGGWLVCVPAHKTPGLYLSSRSLPYVWKADFSDPAVQCDTVYTDNATPTNNYAYCQCGIVTTPERFLLTLCGIPQDKSGIVPVNYADG